MGVVSSFVDCGLFGSFGDDVFGASERFVAGAAGPVGLRLTAASKVDSFDRSTSSRRIIKDVLSMSDAIDDFVVVALLLAVLLSCTDSIGLNAVLRRIAGESTCQTLGGYLVATIGSGGVLMAPANVGFSIDLLRFSFGGVFMGGLFGVVGFGDVRGLVVRCSAISFSIILH